MTWLHRCKYKRRGLSLASAARQRRTRTRTIIHAVILRSPAGKCASLSAEGSTRVAAIEAQGGGCTCQAHLSSRP